VENGDKYMYVTYYVHLDGIKTSDCHLFYIWSTGVCLWFVEQHFQCLSLSCVHSWPSSNWQQNSW